MSFGVDHGTKTIHCADSGVLASPVKIASVDDERGDFPASSPDNNNVVGADAVLFYIPAAADEVAVADCIDSIPIARINAARTTLSRSSAFDAPPVPLPEAFLTAGEIPPVRAPAAQFVLASARMNAD